MIVMALQQKDEKVNYMTLSKKTTSVLAMATIAAGVAVAMSTNFVAKANAATTTSTSTTDTSSNTTKGGPMTGNGRGEGPNVDRSDMGSEQLAQVQSDEANGAPQQNGAQQ